MKAYTFMVCHTVKVYREVTVTARSEVEAEEKAINESGDMDDFDRYGPDNEDYTIDELLFVEEVNDESDIRRRPL
jgi:hypothetical protein